MKTLKRALYLLIAVVMLASTLAACNPATVISDAQQGDYTWDGTPQYGGHLNVRSTSRPSGLDPAKQLNAWKFQWLTTVYEPFLTRDPEYNIQPCVCDYVLELYTDEYGQLHEALWIWPRQGYTFSHGYGQVDMDDIEASWNRGLATYNNAKRLVAPNVLVAERTEPTEAVKAKDPSVTEVFHIDFKYNEKNLYYFATYRTWWPVMPKEICEKYANSYISNELEDAIGTGPYEFSAFKDSTYVTVSKRKDYVPVIQNESQKGMSATKYGYLDSMTFWYNGTDASAANAVLSGQYDCTEVIPAEYKTRAEQSGLVVTKLYTDQRTWMYFNSNGTNNLVAKYPSLRKAIMAAIDYPSFLKVITDDSQMMEGDNILLNELYDLTYKFKEADYYGAYDQTVVDKYLALAREEGYQGEPVQFAHHTGRNDVPTMVAASMENAGIKYELVPMEQSVYNTFIGDPGNNWDFYFAWSVTDHTPGTLSDSLVKNNFKSDRVVEIREKLMPTLDPTSEEYLALWDEWTDIWVEECQLGYMSSIEWWWWHPAALHINDGGDDPNNMCEARFFYNTYWEDPHNHTMQ